MKIRIQEIIEQVVTNGRGYDPLYVYGRRIIGEQTALQSMLKRMEMRDQFQSSKFKENDIEPSYFLNSRKIVYTSVYTNNRDEDYEVYIMDIEANTQKILIE